MTSFSAPAQYERGETVIRDASELILPLFHCCLSLLLLELHHYRAGDYRNLAVGNGQMVEYLDVQVQQRGKPSHTAHYLGRVSRS